MATSQGSPFLKLLDSTRHSDFEIECQGNVFKVHKALLAAKSDFFDRLCDSKFLEGNTNKVKLDDEDPGTVFRMILFIYGDTYSTEPLPDDAPGHGQFNIKDGCVLTFDEVNPQARCYFDTFYHRVVFELRPSQAWKVDWLRRAILHAFMFRIGDKYDIHGLKTYSSRKFLLAYSHFDCSIFENKAASLLNVHRDWHPKHFAKPLRRLSSLIIKLVYEKTPPHSSEIKDALVWDYKLSNESENPINAMITEDMVKTKEDVPEFGADIERH